MSIQDLKEKETGVYDDERSADRPRGASLGNKDKVSNPENHNNSEKSHTAESKNEPLDSTRLESKEQQAGDNAGFWKTGSDSTAREGKSKKKRKRLIVAGTSGGITIGAIIGLLTLISGPLEFLQLDFALNRFNRSSGLVAESRINHGFTRMARAYSTGDIGETRVGIVGSRVFHGINDRLASQHGINFDRRDSSGRPTRIFIDPPEGSALRGATPDETRANIARHLGIPENSIRGLSGTGPGAGAFINIEGVGQTQLRGNIIAGLVRLDTASNNMVSTPMILSLRYRVIGKFWNAPSLFHPLQRSAASAQERYDVRAQRILERNRKTRTGRVAQLSARYVNARDSLRDKIGGGRMASINAALTFTGELCFLGEIADIIPLLNYSLIVQPAMEEALDKKAVSSQLRSGSNFTMDQIGAVQESFGDDAGRSIWGSKSLDALTNGGQGQGAEADPGLKQAFQMRGSSLEILSDTLFDDIPELQALARAGDSFSSVACSTAGYGFQILAGGALSLLVPGGVIAKGAQVGGSIAVHSMIMSWASSFLQDEVAARATDACGFVDEGEEGGLRVEDANKFGACMAYGARGSHNTTLSSMGGVELSTSEEAHLMARLDEQELNNFRSKSLVDRIFDVSEPRSLIARVAQSTNTRSMGANVASIMAGLLKAPYTVISNLMPTASAEPIDYDWGFPLIGVPLSIVEDPRYEDPYRNALEVERLYDSGDIDRYKDKIRDCFGAEIRRVNGVLQATPVSEVVHLEDEYVEANCSDLNDEAWIRIMLFVYDDSIVSSIDCYEGNDSCGDVGLN